MGTYPAPDDAFRGTPRFSVVRRLGGGAFGVVYKVFDRQRNAPVALKTLRRGNEEALYRLKREFRALTDLVHPNLVRLYELLSEGDQWFFTMELVDGAHFLEYVREDPVPPPSVHGAAFLKTVGADADTVSLPSASREQRADPPISSAARASPCVDLHRLREALRQAAAGISAIHAARKLHRDIKSSNVLVSQKGRVILLDFGLVTDLSVVHGEGSLVAAGTPAYMSPEQCVGRDLSEASDWYSLGVMLFEALTGRCPFSGNILEMFEQKRRPAPPAPSKLVADVPPDLDSLCRDLLRPDPASRPAGPEILRRLGAAFDSAIDQVLRYPSPAVPAPFVGRHEQLAELQNAFDDSQKGHCMTVYVHGSSGIGKTALVRNFLSDISASKDVVVISGRCYEREAVPYKALDSLVDALSQYLTRLPAEQADALMPRDVLALARLFPVLRRVDAVAAARRFVLDIPDVQELRRRAFGALRELIGRLADRKSVVFFIDDLHWGDVDSAALLSELLRPPDAPPILLVATYRTEEAATSPLLRRLLFSSSFEARELALRELSPEESRKLAAALLRQAAPGLDSSAEWIARESAGNPFFIDELVRYTSAAEQQRVGLGAKRPASQATLEQVIQARLSWLSPEARRFLEIVAVAGRPLETALVREAAALQGSDDAVVELRAAHLIRTRGTERADEVEIYHDRVRASILGLLSTVTLESHHRRLGQALEASGRGDPEALTQHFREASERARAAEYAPVAAARAAQALAFDRAARLYHLALELYEGGEDEQRRQLRIKLGDALSNAGRGTEAASAYLAAIRGAKVALSLELQRKAAEQLLRSGHLDEGLPVLREVLSMVGLRLVEAPWAAVLHFLTRRAFIRLRGLRFRERDASQIPEETLIKIDACWSASMGLSMVDTIRGKDFQARHLLLALKAGEPYRIARAVANEAGYSATAGRRNVRRTQELVQKAVTLADRVGEPQAIGIAQVAVGITAYLEGRWKTSWELSQMAEQILRERCTGVAWELDTTHIYSLRALFYLGRLAELQLLLPLLLQEAREKDDLFAITSLKTRHGYIASLAMDRAESARRELSDALESWSKQGFHLQHFFALIAEVDIGLYSGESQRAWALIHERERDLRRSRLLRVQLFRIEWLHARARAAVARAAESRDPERRALLREAESCASRIERESLFWAAPLAAAIRGAVASLRGEHDAVRRRLHAALEGFDAADMALYAAATRFQLARFLGSEGSPLAERAEEWMRQQKVLNPERMAPLLVPGIDVPRGDLTRRVS